MKLAICPGSFDPVTNGHLDIIQRASGLFDKVIVLVACNREKKHVFTEDERADMIRRVTTDIPNVEVDTFDGLLVDYVERSGATTIVKGLRAVTDFEYEFQMALINRKLFPNCETVFLTTSAENMYLSSSIVRQVASFGGDISGLVPGEVLEQIVGRLKMK